MEPPVVLANLVEYRQGLAAQPGTAGLQAQPEHWQHLGAGEHQKKLSFESKISHEEEVYSQCVKSTNL